MQTDAEFLAPLMPDVRDDDGTGKWYGLKANWSDPIRGLRAIRGQTI